MASSVLPGERRWGSARRGGMTVLGKVAVPKPVNLPSQRLENHGLDPNVEIVPKGTLSWGSRSSSSAQNAWGSSSLSSPNTDGGTGSPSRLNDRPSSGGSGTRPSTAGSEKPHETVPNIWGSNSRPSSASGVLASNKTLTSASRPRSAETQPGSSQLSRFADPIAENSVAWGSSRTAEKLGAPYGKNDGFTLSSGDFPTLGSEKPTELEGRNGHRSQERPVSASGRVGTSGERLETLTKEDESSVDATRNDWRNDNSPFAGAPPRTDKWWMDAQTYPDPMMNSQQFGPWHGPVHNAPDGVWYRGPPGGPPFRPPGPPGSYPVEPFPYYHPRLPAQPPANMQPIPRAVSGPSGYHANNGNSYRPHGPDPYMQPVMPVRPGAYAVPVPYEGYYGPPRAGFCNPNDRDPIMGMGTGPGAYNRFPVQSAHPETGNIQARQGGYDSASMVMSKEQVEPGQPHGAHAGPYKVLLKQHDNWEENDGKEKRELGVNEQHRRAKLPGPPAREVELRVGGNNESVESSKLLAVEETSQSADARGEHSSGPVKSSLPESMNKDKAASDSLAKISEVAPVTGDAPQKNLSSTKKIPTLIEKIEGLNNKVRNSDGRSDAGHISIKDEKLKSSATVNARTDNVTKVALGNVVSDGKVSLSEPLAPSNEKEGTLAVEKKIEASVPLSTRELQTPAVSVSNSSESRDGSHSYSQRRPQGVQSRTEHYGKTKHNHLEGDQWRKKPVVADAPVVSSSKNVELSSHKPALECLSTEMTSGESDINIQGKSVGESNAKSAFDSSDHKAQRVKMREIAAQRARQLQKEEEERTREQKAKALAKLEELNRRTLTEASTVRADDSVSSSKVVQNKQEEILDNAGPPPLLGSSGTSASLNCNVNSVGQTSDKNIDKLGDVATLPKEGPPQEALPHSTEEIMVKHNLHLPSTSEISKDGSEQKIAASHDSGAVKQKQTGNKRKQTNDKNLFEGSISFGSFGDPKDHGIVITSSGECHWPSNASGTDNQSVQHKKKNNRNSKNKQKVDTQSTMHMEEIPVKASDEGSNLKNSNSLSDATTVRELNSNGTAEGQSSQVVVPVTDQGLSTHTQEANSKSKHQPKPLPARWMSKNAQTNRMDKQHNGDNVVWAPVRSPLNKTEASEGAVVRSTTSETHIPLVNGHEAQNNHKSKRAEMERYVPKPVAKELSQQGNLQRPSSSSVQQVLSDENTGRTSSFGIAISEPDGLATGKGAFAAPVKNGENKHNKHGKAQGLWRQRVSADSSSVNPAEGSSFSSNPSKAVHVSTEQNQSTKEDTNVSKERARYPEISSASNSSLPTKEFSAEGVSKDQGLTVRGKRHTSKGHKGMYQNQNNSENDVHGEGTFESSGLTPGSNQSAGRSISGENLGVGAHSSSHWQPKPQAFVDHNRQTTKGNVGQKVVKASRKDSPPQGGSSASRNDRQNSRALHPHSDSDFQSIDITGAPNMHHGDAKPERKVLDSSEGGPLPDQPNISKTEEQVIPDDVNDQQGRSVSSGFRRHVHYNGRFGRGQEGNKQVRVQGNGERRKNSSHYEYHPARSHNTDANESFEEDSRGRSLRYREKGQTHSRHGRANYYERESGNIQVTVSYDKGE